MPNFTWLPRCLTISKPAALSFLLTSRYDSRLGGTDVDLELHELWFPFSHRLLEVQLQRFAQVRDGFLFRRALAGDVHLQALGDEEVFFLP